MKLLTLGGTALLTFFATVNVNAESSVGYEEATFEMGGQGPAGGVIFYLTDNKLHGMESAG
ncbi:hypothetical protein BMR02_13955 [Methylococcaceae bacterium HT1]|nr:hypothetical protein BMR02_13955 [Methylococcaceae bacterium HT1]